MYQLKDYNLKFLVAIVDDLYWKFYCQIYIYFFFKKKTRKPPIKINDWVCATKFQIWASKTSPAWKVFFSDKKQNKFIKTKKTTSFKTNIKSYFFNHDNIRPQRIQQKLMFRRAARRHADHTRSTQHVELCPLLHTLQRSNSRVKLSRCRGDDVIMSTVW